MSSDTTKGERYQLKLDPEDEDKAMQVAILQLIGDGMELDREAHLGNLILTLPKQHLEARDLMQELFHKIGVFEAYEAVRQARETASMIFTRKV